VTSELIIDRAGVDVTIQDLGRPGAMGLGLSRGGAADRHAFLQGAALLQNGLKCAALELSVGGQFRVTSHTRAALSGARADATLNGQKLLPCASFLLAPNDVLKVGPARGGIYTYLHFAGGIQSEPELGGRGRHRIAGLGDDLADGDTLILGKDPNPKAPPVILPITATPSTSIRRSNVTTERAVISLLVSVPVWSEQIAETEPRVSTAGSRRIMALRRAMRRTPTARVTVITAGSPSGMAATASPITAINP